MIPQRSKVHGASFFILLLLHAAVRAEETNAEKMQATDDDEDFTVPELDPRNPFYKGRPSIVFGSHAEPTQLVDEIGPDQDFPNPEEFYQRYIKQYKPVVVRGAAKRSPAYHLWTEEYLKENYGNLTVRLEARSEGSSRYPSGIGGLGRDTLGNFVDRYQDLDGYVISQVPTPMERDIFFPSFLTCGSLSQGLQEVHLFFSAKGGKTLLHRDPYSSFHCVFNGTKQWIVADPTQKDKLYMAEDSRYEFGGYSTVNVDDINYQTHPGAKDLKFGKIILHKGDCIYMPSGYTHQVRSRGFMNTAVSIWFSHYLPFYPSACKGVGNGFKPMSESPVLWRYSGFGELSQGHMDIHMLKMVMKTTADKTGKIWLEEYTNNFIQGEKFDEDVLIARRLEFTKKLDPDQTGFITVDEVNALSLEKMKELIEVIDPTDPANREDYEYLHITKDGIWGLFSMLRGTNPSQKFKSSDFIKIYTIYLGGTEAVAKEILSVLDPNGTDAISSRMVMENADAALAKFQENYHDPTIEHLWYKQLAVTDLFQQFGVMHFDDPREQTEGDKTDDDDDESVVGCPGGFEDGEMEVQYVDDLDSGNVCDVVKNKAKTDEALGGGADVKDQNSDADKKTEEHDEL